jgi:hypothetical protein
VVLPSRRCLQHHSAAAATRSSLSFAASLLSVAIAGIIFELGCELLAQLELVPVGPCPPAVSPPRAALARVGRPRSCSLASLLHPARRVV